MSKNKAEIHDEIFEALLIPAAKEALRREMEELPSEEELKKLCPISDDLNDKIKKMIDNHAKTQRRKRRMKKFSKIVAGFTVLSAITGTVFMSIEASRNLIRNSIVNMRNDHIIFEFTGGGHGSGLVINYVPYGFEIISTHVTDELYVVVYSNDIGELIMIRWHLADYLTLGIDNEAREFSTISVGEQKAYLFQPLYDGYETILMWYINNNAFDITSTLEMEQILKIAENLIFR